MQFEWDESRHAYADVARWFVSTVALAADHWERPGLGDWDVRALVGHTSRALITVEEYLSRPAGATEVATATDYFRATREIAAGSGVAQRGVDAGEALGPDPEDAVAAIAERVLRRVEACDGTELVTTIAGGMRLADYLPTRTFELAVHTSDLATAIAQPIDVPASAAVQALAIVAELAVEDGSVAGRLLLAATGRARAAADLSVL